MKYRKKPVVIEAVQFKGDIKPIREFMGDNDCLSFNPISGKYSVKNLDGIMEISAYDMIIKGVNDEFYPCKIDIFGKTYELVEEE